MHQARSSQRDAVHGIKQLEWLFVLHLTKARVYGWEEVESLVSRSNTLMVGHWRHSNQENICRKDSGRLLTYGGKVN